ncbi:glycosyltransferase family 2 protein [Lishizhenia sp.]|uniref:glycosyltransferase family 2 protein n=1 Tax=Lishizhenia sp. TaxID=2497594 RepID=UPI00299EEB96|nr:glycosyltransferase family 2 protein [Lishizhenia sp.]MDX1446767.1 glycosyltransferase family 2 protein [Lishizhenia sp.]
MSQAKVAVVILNWNGKAYLEQFLPSVVKYSEGHQIIVADNASTDDSISFLKANYPSIDIIVNTSNGGFAKGYNDALKQVKADYYVLLNSDVEVTANWVDIMLEELESNSGCVGVQPKVLAYHNKSVFEHAGAAGGFIDKNYYPFCRGRIFGDVEEDKGQYDGVREVFWTTGACMLVNAKAYHEVGGLDEDFFAHMEEIDMCWRLKNRGYSFFAAPKAVVYHVGGGTLNYESPNKTYLNFRNSLYMIHKNYKGILPLFIFKRLILDGIAALKFAVKFKFKHLWAIGRAHANYYQQLPKLNAKRKALKKATSNLEANKAGFYTGSLLFARFFKGITAFSKLNQRLFK